MRYRNTIAIMSVVTLIFAYGCSKKSNDPSSTTSASTAPNYVITSNTMTVDGQPITFEKDKFTNAEWTASYQDCELCYGDLSLGFNDGELAYGSSISMSGNGYYSPHPSGFIPGNWKNGMEITAADLNYEGSWNLGFYTTNDTSWYMTSIIPEAAQGSISVKEFVEGGMFGVKKLSLNFNDVKLASYHDSSKVITITGAVTGDYR